MIRVRRILVLAALVAACSLMLSSCLIVPAGPRTAAAPARQTPPQAKPVQPAPARQTPAPQQRRVIYPRGRVHQVTGVVTVIRGGYQIRDDRSDTIFIFINLSREDSARFQRSVGKRMTVNLAVDSGEDTAAINAHVVN